MFIDLSPDKAADEIWDKHKDELGVGRLNVWVNSSTSGPCFIGSHMPPFPNHTEIELGDSIEGTLQNGFNYQVDKWRKRVKP